MKKFLRTILLGVGLIALTACSGGPADLPTISKEEGEAKYAAIKQKENEIKQDSTSASFTFPDAFTLTLNASMTSANGSYTTKEVVAFDLVNHYVHLYEEESSGQQSGTSEMWVYYKDGKARQVTIRNNGTPDVREAEIAPADLDNAFKEIKEQAKNAWLSASDYGTIDQYLNQYKDMPGVNLTYGSDGTEGSLQIKLSGNVNEANINMSVEANVIFSNYFLTYVSANISGTANGEQGSMSMSLETRTSCDLNYPNA